MGTSVSCMSVCMGLRLLCMESQDTSVHLSTGTLFRHSLYCLCMRVASFVSHSLTVSPLLLFSGVSDNSVRCHGAGAEAQARAGRGV